ncbi:MAG: NADH-quinone oxidoreductase subunit L [Oligoflexia bacterium]|nr:NADH-quinone oxidoreductase subunit L [Oligoflexia bacterium]
MNLILFLIIFPFVISLILRPNLLPEGLQKGLISISTLVLAVASIMLCFDPNEISSQLLQLTFSHYQQLFLFVVEIGLAILIYYFSFKYDKIWVAFVNTIQLMLLIVLETKVKFNLENNIGNASNLFTKSIFFIDNFSIIMALIIGIIGGLIAIYANGYMKDFHHHHKEMKDKRSSFFFVIFMFLSAMFGIVFSDNLLWLHFFWEITTLASFLLIGYKGDKVSIDNAFRALLYNLIGGVGFVVGILYFYMASGSFSLDQLINAGKSGFLIPVLLLAFAGFSKSAQMPFSSWLLGAMVAPTPVSALLHSSTMVKAGVYLVIKLAPALMGTWAGILVASVGGITFLTASMIAISRQNAKSVLAYSTIANLGLIVLCAGIGSPMAVWAGIMIIIFHAISKGLLFLSVGVAEHRIDSREIEAMDGLVVSLPNLSFLLLLGMAGMFLAPFAMLISKWAVIKAIIDPAPLLLIPIVFGSAATLFYWVKWMGKLLAITTNETNNPNNTNKTTAATLEKAISNYEWCALYPLGFLTIISTIIFPLTSGFMLEPYLSKHYNLGAGYFNLWQENIILMTLLLILLLLLPLLSKIFISANNKKTRVTAPYLAGANVNDGYHYQGSLQTMKYTIRNYYLESFFGERCWSLVGIILAIVTMLIMLFSVRF